MLNVKRPIIWTFLAYATGIALSIWIEQQIVIFLVLALASSLVAWILRKHSKWCFSFALLAIFAIGVIVSIQAKNPGDPLKEFVGIESSFSAKVEKVIELSNDLDAYVVRINNNSAGTFAGKDIARARINIYPARDKPLTQRFAYGDLIEFTGILEMPRERRNPAGFDYRKFLAARNVQYTVSLTAIDVNKVGRISSGIFISVFEFVRNRAHAVFLNSVGGRESALMIAMMLGDRWLLPDDLTMDFRQTGLSHIIAISGLHVGFILLMLEQLFNLLPVSKKIALLSKIALLWFYCILVGAAPSVLRAVFMATVYLLGKLAGRKSDAVNCLFLAALGILSLRPLDLFDVGFQLSFAAVAGIILYNARIEKLIGFLPKWIASVLSVTIAAQLGVVPLIAYHFNIISPVSLPANLIFVPLSGLMVCFGFIVMTVGLVSTMLAQMIGWPLKIMTWIFIEGAQLASQLPYSSINVVSPAILALVCFYIAFVIFSAEKPFWVKNVKIWCAVLIMVPILFSFAQPIFNNNLRVVFLDVGQGDSIYIKTPDEKHILIDGGGRLFGSGRFEPGEDIVVPFLLKNGVGSLDLLIKSHDHSDHIGGLLAVAEILPIETFMEFPPSEGSENYKMLKNIIRRNNVNSLKVYAGQVYNIGRYVTIEVLYPDLQGETLNKFYNGNANNRSLVFLLRYKYAEVLFTGDVYAEVESYISEGWSKNVDILKVAHHGSRTSSSQDWIDAVNPYLAVIQVGRNSFGHPHMEVLDRFQYNGVKVMRNDLHGAIICEFDGQNWTIRSMIR